MGHSVIEKWKQQARRLKKEAYALCLACRHRRTPWYARAFAALVVAYALSPIDLIPDFVPVLGHLDDLILVPLGVALALRMIPTSVMAECRMQAETAPQDGRPGGRLVAVGIVAAWLALAALVIWGVMRRLG